MRLPKVVVNAQGKHQHEEHDKPPGHRLSISMSSTSAVPAKACIEYTAWLNLQYRVEQEFQR